MLEQRELRALAGPILICMILGMMVLPLPPFLLDVLFTFNIALSRDGAARQHVHACSRSTSRRSRRVLLLATLLRLSLNVASTRVVLLDGHTGPDAAGKVIEAFGHFLVGGNFAVGIVVFAILVVINFIVVTKGAGRIAEVGARFTLDAMPGKQMAIDADLNAGLIDEEEARSAAPKSAQEAEFYGSMDGACEVRARRRGRRHPDPVHQHRRRPRRRRRCSTTWTSRRRRTTLHAARDRRRPGRADPGADDLDRGRRDRRRASATSRTSARR